MGTSYLGQINFFTQKSLKISGFIPHNTARFSIILQTDTDNSVDCIQGLHISFEFDENRVIRHFYSNEECKEEIHEGMPLSRGFPFFIQIDVGNDQDEYVYIVLINGKRFYKFFEIPTGLMKKIRYIKICGDVNISRVH